MSLTTKRIYLFLALFSCFSFKVFAELTSLSDNDLSEVDGAGVGLVMDNFVFSHGNNVLSSF